jgi:hypothetical protein
VYLLRIFLFFIKNHNDFFSFFFSVCVALQVTIPSTAVRTETNGKLFTIFILHVRADVPTAAETGGIQIETKHWVIERRCDIVFSMSMCVFIYVCA